MSVKHDGDNIPSTAYTFGDPHIKTLDGKQYTFNGYGEYTMLRVHNVNKTFTLQARTDLAMTAEGNTTNATVFSAFAAKDHSNATLQVELSVNRTCKYGINMYMIRLLYLSINLRKKSSPFKCA